jgi:hypothetical protein
MIRFGADTVIRMGDIEDEDFDIEDVSEDFIFVSMSSLCSVYNSRRQNILFASYSASVLYTRCVAQHPRCTCVSCTSNFAKTFPEQKLLITHGDGDLHSEQDKLFLNSLMTGDI